MFSQLVLAISNVEVQERNKTKTRGVRENVTEQVGSNWNPEAWVAFAQQKREEHTIQGPKEPEGQLRNVSLWPPSMGAKKWQVAAFWVSSTSPRCRLCQLKSPAADVRSTPRAVPGKSREHSACVWTGVAGSLSQRQQSIGGSCRVVSTPTGHYRSISQYDLRYCSWVHGLQAQNIAENSMSQSSILSKHFFSA